MYEPSWGVEEDERRQQLLQSLERTLRSENSSLAQYEVHVLDIEPLDELPATAGWRERLEQASADQRVVIDLCLAHLALPEPDAPELSALHGRPGGGKSFALNINLDAARDAGHTCVPCAHPTKVAVTFKGGNAVHFQLGLPCSERNEPIEINMAAPPACRATRPLACVSTRCPCMLIDLPPAA